MVEAPSTLESDPIGAPVLEPGVRADPADAPDEDVLPSVEQSPQAVARGQQRSCNYQLFVSHGALPFLPIALC